MQQMQRNPQAFVLVWRIMGRVMQQLQKSINPQMVGVLDPLICSLPRWEARRI